MVLRTALRVDESLLRLFWIRISRGSGSALLVLQLGTEWFLPAQASLLRDVVIFAAVTCSQASWNCCTSAS
jgi:hypothetical protein